MSFLDETLKKLGIDEIFFKHEKNYRKLTAHKILNHERLNAFPLMSE